MEKWQKELIRYLFHYSARHLQIERGIQTKNPHIPERLYKYREFSKNHKEALVNNILRRCSPNKFNDPYDTSVYFNTDHFFIENRSLKDAIQNAETSSEETVSRRPPPIKNAIRIEDWRRRIFEEIISTVPDSISGFSDVCEIVESIFEQQNETSVSRFTEHWQSGFSVVSLSQVPSSILMWSHYSDAHKGFCIEYDFSSISADDLRRRLCFPVYYRKKLTDATRYFAQRDPANVNNLFGQYLCLLKSDEWAYEREWRIVIPTGPSDANAEILMPKPSSIVLGMRVEENNRKWMIEHCKRNDISLKKVRQRRDAFHLGVNTSVPSASSSMRARSMSIGR